MISYVHKFGGSLMGNGKLLTNVIKTIKHDKINNIRPIFVVSALNPNADKRTGTTTLLEKAYSSNNTERDFVIQDIYNIHSNLLDYFGLSISKNINNLFDKAKQINVEEHTLNDMIQFGELLSAETLNEIMNNNGISCRVGKLDDGLRGKDYSFLTYQERLRLLQMFKKSLCDQYFESRKSMVFPGFFHIGSAGTIKTMNRGYTDTTGALISAAISARKYCVWKESGGVFTAHPILFPSAKALKIIHIDEAIELTAFGNDVVHPFASDILKDNSIEINIKDANIIRSYNTQIINTNNDDSIPYINNTKYKNKLITAISLKSNVCILDYNSSDNKVQEFILSNNPILLAGSRRGISAVVSEDSINLNNPSSLGTNNIRRNRSIIGCIGKNMRGHVGFASEAMGVLAAVGVNIELILQGSSELSIIIVVRQQHERLAVEALHNKFIIQ